MLGDAGLLSLGLYFGLLFFFSFTSGLIGLGLQHLGLAGGASPVALGFSFALIASYITCKIGAPGLVPSTLGLMLLLAIAILVRSHIKGEVVFARLAILLKRVFLFVFIFLLAIITQIWALSGRGLNLTSFDTTAGDMSSYLEMSENLRNVGWGGLSNSYDLGPTDDVLGKLTWVFEHIGSGGYVLLASIAQIFNVPTWQIGTIGLGLAFIALLSSATALIERTSRKSTFLSAALGVSAFATTGFLSTLGWWALNQIIFTSVLLTALAILDSLASGKKTPANYLLFGALIALAFEVYPSIAFYSAIPLLISALVLAMAGSIRTSAGTRRLSPLLMALPLGYSLLGTAQFLPTVFKEQFSHDLDMGVEAPRFIDFLGLRPVFKFLNITELEVFGSFQFWGLAFLAFLGWHALRHKKDFGRNVHLYAIGIGGSCLIFYSTLIPETTYQAHKLRMLWVPVLLVIMFSVLDLGKIRKKTLPKHKRREIVSVFAIATSVVFNLFVFSTASSAYLKDDTSRQMLSVTKEKVDLGSALKKLDVPAVATDFSRGKGWVPLDRVILPAILNYPGSAIYSGARLAGYNAMTGWVVTGGQSMEPGSDTSQYFYSNEFYSIKHVCRILCSASDSGMIAFLSGWDAVSNEYSKYADTSFRKAVNGLSLDIKIHSRSRETITAFVSFGNSSCSTQEYSTELDEFGLGRIKLKVSDSCMKQIRKISLRGDD